MKKIELNGLVGIKGGDNPCEKNAGMYYGAGLTLMMVPIPGVQIAGLLVASAGYIMGSDC